MTTLSLLMVMMPVASLPCPRPCSCPQLAELHCTFRSLIAVPVGISKQVERMNLGFNTINKLTERSLADLRRLEILMLHGNNIPNIPNGAFRDLLALQMLKMSYNKLTEITRETLQGLWALARLHLDHNRLEFIQPDAFQGLTSLRLLQLEGNHLQQLHPSTFATFSLAGHFHASTLRHLYLSENGLTSLPAGMLEGMPQLENLFLHGNPWRCDCHMEWFPDWDKNSPGVVKCKKDRAYPGGQLCPMCSSPAHLRMKELQGLDRLRCSAAVILSPPRADAALQEDAESEVMSPREFREPLGNVTLGLSDEHGNKVDLECAVSEPRPTATRGARVAWEQLDPLRLAANATLDVDLECPIDRENYERLWRLVAYYSDAPAHLQREVMLAKEPRPSYRYRQDAERDALYYTGVRASVAALPAWLMQPSLDLRLNRPQSTATNVWLILGARLARTVEAERERSSRRPWVFVQATNATRTAVAAVVGGAVRLDCNVRSSGQPSIRWTLPDGTKAEAPFSSPDGRVSVSSGGRLALHAVGHSDAGVYYCVASLSGDVAVLPFRLTVEESSSPPPGGARAPAPVEGYAGEPVALPCVAAGSPDPDVTWILPDGDTLGVHGNGSRARVYANGTLRLPQARLSDSGYYKCVAMNQHGADSVATKVTLTRRAGLRPLRKYPTRPQSAAGVNTQIKVPTGESTGIKVPVEDVEESSGDDDADGQDKAAPGRLDLLTRRRGPSTGGHPSRNMWRRPSTAGSRVPDGRTNVPHTRRRVNVANKKIDPEKWADIMAKIRDRAGVTTAAAALEVPDHAVGSSEASAPEETPRHTAVRRPHPEPHTHPTGRRYASGAAATSPLANSETRVGLGPHSGAFRQGQSPAPDGGPPTERGVAATLTERAASVVEGADGGAELPQSGREGSPPPTAADTRSAPATEADGGSSTGTSEATESTRHGPAEAAALGVPTFSPILTTAYPPTTATPARGKEAAGDGGAHLRSPNSRRRNGERRRRPNRRKPRPNLSKELTPTDALPETAVTAAAVRPKVESPGSASAATAESDGGVPFTESQASSSARPSHSGSPVAVRDHAASAASRPPLRASASRSQTGDGSLPRGDPPITSASAGPPFPTTSPDAGGMRGQTSPRWPTPSQRPALKAASPAVTSPGRVTSAPHSAGRPSEETRGEGDLRPVPSPDRSGGRPNVEADQSWSRPHGPPRAGNVPLVTTRGPGTSERSFLATRQTTRTKPGSAPGGGKETFFTGDISNTVGNTTDRATTVSATSTRLSSVDPYLPLPDTPRPTEGRGPPPSRPLEGPNHIPDSHGERGQGPDHSSHVPSNGNPDVVGPQPHGGSVLTTWGTGLRLIPGPTTAEAPGTHSRGQPTQKTATATTPVTTIPSVSGGHSPSIEGLGTGTQPQIPAVVTRPPSAGGVAGGGGGGGGLTGSVPRGKPRILNRDVQTVSVMAETDAQLPCETEGEPRPFLSWTKVSTGASVAQNTRVQRLEVHPNGTLIIRNAQHLDRGQYLCMVQNQYGVDRTVVNLVVLAQHPRVFQPQYRDLSVHLGDTIDLDCHAQGHLASRVTWILPNRVHMAAAATPAGPPQRLSLLTNGTLRLRQAGYSDRGVYKCVAGADGVSVRLLVSALPPSIHQALSENVTLPEGSTAYLPCSARGAPTPVVRWTTPDGLQLLPSQFVQGRNLFVFPNGTLYVRGLGRGDVGTYECSASNSVGAARRTAVLAVLRTATSTKARITSSSSSSQKTDVMYGAKLQLDCLAKGVPEPRILWRTPSKKLVDAHYSFDSRIKVFPNGTLTVQAITDEDSGDYLCVARNKMGDDYVLLGVNVMTRPAKIQHKQPQGNQEVMYGGDLKVDCIASGLPDPEITWALPDGTMVNPVKLAERSGSGAVGGRSRRYVVFDNGTLYLNEVGMREQGDYTCYAENQLGKDQMRVRVKVVADPPRIRGQSHEVVSVLYGETVSLGCSAKGEPSPVYSWISPTNRAISSDSGKHQVLSDGTLVVRKAQRYDGGNYTCTARNSAGQARKVTRLDVLVTPPTINGLRGVSNALGATAVRDQRKLLDCVATGTPPPRVMWVLPENVILPAPYQGSRMTVHPNGTLDIRAPKTSDSSQLVCVARNEGGEATLTVRLEVRELEEKPQIRGPKTESLWLTTGSAMTLDCSFQGASRPQVTWILPDGTPLSSGAHFSKFSHRPNGSLVISNPSVSDVGMYRCLGRNAGGLAERAVTLAPGRQPEIVTRYSSPVSVMNGETLLLHCLASGEPVRLTWTLPSGVVLARPQRAGRYAVLANGTLAIRRASVYDRGAYACRASNAHGSALLPVPVVVAAAAAYPPRITGGPAAVTYARRGVAVQLNCAATGMPKAEVAWETPDGTRLAVGASPRLFGNKYLHPQGSLIIQNPTQRDAGYYRCAARNVMGVDTIATYLNVF
ncbi:matrix-remodeling-associated protein 5 [Aplochiton taeniatus]